MSTTQSIEKAAKREFLDQFKDPVLNTYNVSKNHNYPDSRSIRDYHGGIGPGDKDNEGNSLGGISPWSPEKYEWKSLWPAIIDTTWESTEGKIVGGTDLLTIGKPGSGKSTLANHMAMRAMEGLQPYERYKTEKNSVSKIVWRGSSSRSEWLPLAPWTTLALPEGVNYQAKFVPRVPTEETYTLSLEDLKEHVVRDIVRYEDPIHLNNELLDVGQFHVVYPDPEMRGLQAIYEDSDEKRYDAPSDRTLFHREDPANHWWFGWVLARIEHGPHDWTTLILDEIGDIAPEAARKDQFGTYQKIQLLKDAWVDARKMGLSIFAFGHSEEDIHNMIRRKIRWRMYLHGSANPTSKSEVVGFNNIPMDKSHLASKYEYAGLVFNEENFDWISWPEYYTPVEHKLKLERVG